MIVSKIFQIVKLISLKQFMSKRLLITGATGSAGAHLTRYFSQKGYQVIATGRASSAPQALYDFASYHQADISKPHTLPDADICIHTAALSDDKARLKELVLHNLRGTENTINAAKNCSKFIFISSSSVYLPESLPIKEELAGKQNNKDLSPYGYSKLLSEIKIKKHNTFDSTFILRPRAHYGIGDKKILPRIFKLVQNEIIKKPGKLNVNVSLTHFDNLAHAVECCINSDKKGISTYNVSDAKPYVFIEVIRKITEAIYNRKLPEKEISLSVLKAMSLFKINGISKLLVRSLTTDMVLDISKIKKEIHYTPVKTLEETTESLAQWIESIGGPKNLKEENKLLAWTL